MIVSFFPGKVWRYDLAAYLSCRRKKSLECSGDQRFLGLTDWGILCVYTESNVFRMRITSRRFQVLECIPEQTGEKLLGRKNVLKESCGAVESYVRNCCH
ncbi:hypothetical protein AVEN_97380-1 [Araneus ventricosus]|uniref:Uncharacterized protein n=1 Tax=Araneus ventricosus TaxID=182803 RepID=A0A4Y2R6D9_ARAVE|nr:hypothetical protein AVEN_97380-1 [Araneus ventricosus]